jgi:hypothetical protein
MYSVIAVSTQTKVCMCMTDDMDRNFQFGLHYSSKANYVFLGSIISNDDFVRFTTLNRYC